LTTFVVDAGVWLASADRDDAHHGSDAAALALERGLSVYDAAYVAAARRRGASLVSLDVADLVRPGLAVLPEEALRA
jgi:predicted nucleic acid-binding protein